MSALYDEVVAYANANDNLPMEASATGLLDTLSSSIGKVADFGFNVQRQQLAVQSQAQDNQLKALLGTLGFKTAVTQANAQAQVAQYQAQGQVAQAARAAGVSGGGISTQMLLLVGVGLFLALKK
jgi:hypothetical protein